MWPSHAHSRDSLAAFPRQIPHLAAILRPPEFWQGGGMVHVELDRVVEGTGVAGAWERLIDVSRWPDYFPGVEEVAPVDGGEFAPGFSWLEKRSAAGFSGERRWQLVSVSPYAEFTAESLDSGERTRITWAVAPRGEDGALLSTRYERELEHAPMIVAVAQRLTDPLHARAVAKALRRDLEAFAAQA
ncbi:SRPBCC family protein [Dietzia sp.]|uniref:SRPBCC family protein n=1 Tax=Dietzia sp. TaxID=1871616 RepID=UPI002FDB3DFC